MIICQRNNTSLQNSQEHKQKDDSRNRVLPGCGNLNRLPKNKTERPNNRTLSRYEINSYRLSFYEQMCISLLHAGYHRSFTEISELVEKDQREDIELSGGKRLSEKNETLRIIVKQLMAIEIAERNKDYEQMYSRYLKLARHFNQKAEDMLTNNFYHRASEVSQKSLSISQYQLTKRHTEAEDSILAQNTVSKAKLRFVESLFNILKYKQEKGDHENALNDGYKLYNELNVIQQEQLQLEEHRRIRIKPLLMKLCEAMCDSLFVKAEIAATKNDENEVQYLNEAQKFAREAENFALIGQCKGRLSRLHSKQGQLDEAFQNANDHYVISAKLNKTHRIEACEELVEICERMKNYRNCQKYLEEMKKLALEINDHALIARADMLASRFYSLKLNDFAKAEQIARGALQLALRARDSQTAKHLRLWCAASKCKNMQTNYLAVLLCSQTDSRAMNELLAWKNTRTELDQIHETDFLRFTRQTFFDRMKTCRTRA